MRIKNTYICIILILVLTMFLFGCSFDAVPPDGDETITTDVYAIEYFQGSEANYRTINKDHSPDDIIDVLGPPMFKEEYDYEGLYTIELLYPDSSYRFENNTDENDNLVEGYTLKEINVSQGNYPIFRDIMIGDSFEDIMSKLPRERDWLSDPDEVFYGTGVKEEDSFGGTCYVWEYEDGTTYKQVTLKDEDNVALVYLEFYSEVLDSMMICYL